MKIPANRSNCIDPSYLSDKHDCQPFWEGHLNDKHTCTDMPRLNATRHTLLPDV